MRAFTLVELIITIAIISIISVASTPFLSSFILRNNLDLATNQLNSSLLKAQTYAKTNKNDQVWGICKTGNLVRLFSGDCTSPVFFEDFSIPASVSISGLDQAIIFSNIYGLPTNSVLINLSTDLDTKTISISSLGVIGQ